MLYRRSQRKEIGLDLSPLIDVVFLLLIFFMVSTRFKEDHGLDLDLPKTETSQAKEVERLTLTIDKDQVIRLQEEKLAKSDLVDVIRRSLADFDDKMVILKVDQTVNHGKVVAIMDAARQAGAEGLTFAAEANK